MSIQDRPRPYECPTCDKAFNRKGHRKRHISIHTEERPHACHYSHCTSRFKRSDELVRHSRIHKSPNSRRISKPYACQFSGCQKQFSQSEILKRHSRIHNKPDSGLSTRSRIATMSPLRDTMAASNSNIELSSVSLPYSYPPRSINTFPVLYPRGRSIMASPNSRSYDHINLSILALAAFQVEMNDEHLKQSNARFHHQLYHHHSHLYHQC